MAKWIDFWSKEQLILRILFRLMKSSIKNKFIGVVFRMHIFGIFKLWPCNNNNNNNNTTLLLHNDVNNNNNKNETKNKNEYQMEFAPREWSCSPSEIVVYRKTKKGVEWGEKVWYDSRNKKGYLYASGELGGMGGSQIETLLIHVLLPFLLFLCLSILTSNIFRKKKCSFI